MSRAESSPAFGVALFHSVHGALAAERRLEAAGVAYKLIAVPSHLSSNCGFCIRFDWTRRDEVERLLADTSLGIERIVRL